MARYAVSPGEAREDMDDLGPSEADLEHFGDDGDHAQLGYCPECGVECWDEAEYCPDCSAPIGSRVLGKPKVEHDLQRRFTVVVVVLVLIAFIWIVL